MIANIILGIACLIMACMLIFHKKEIACFTKEVIRYAVGEPVKGSLFVVQVFNKQRYETEHKTLGYGMPRGHSYFQDSHYYLTCKAAFEAYPNTSVTKTSAYLIDGKWFVGDLKHVSVN